MSREDDPVLSSVPLADDVIELRVLRVLRPGDLSARPREARFLSPALEYRFAIHRRTDDLRDGRIHLRLTGDPAIVQRSSDPHEAPADHRVRRNASSMISRIAGQRLGMPKAAEIRDSAGENSSRAKSRLRWFTPVVASLADS